ncbi:MAG: hypothetical protein AB8B50_12290 [Pirellulaceae bacterium]
MEAIYRDYKGKNVDFYFVYKSLAHPQGNGFVRPTTIEERLLHVQAAKKGMGTSIPWLADTMENDFKHAMGNRSNSEFVIDPKGKIVRMRDWSNPITLREDLIALVGPVEKPTRPSDLKLVTKFEPTEVARGVVERVQPTGRMAAFKVETKQPFANPAYVKLRAEGDGRGQLYLGFFVDPIYKVHWNNQAGPVQIEVEGQTHVGPRVSEKADADPREFLIEVKGDATVTVTLKYVACDDEETWCKTLTQTFVVVQERDRDAGRVSAQRPGGGRRGGFGQGRAGGRRPGPQGTPGRGPSF